MKDGKKCSVTLVAVILLIIGGLNWGLIGLGGFVGKDLNVVNMLLGSWPTVEWVVYLLVGVAAIWKLVVWAKCCGEGCQSHD